MEDDLKGWHSRGFLPHFDGGEITQSITIRLADSFPRQRLLQWQEEVKNLSKEKADSLRQKRIEEYLDLGFGATLLSDPSVAEIVQDALLFFDGKRYCLDAWVIMPNHVHVLATLKSGFALSEIVHSFKSFTASKANRLLSRTGAFWQEDYFDRYIRSIEHFAKAFEYIESNPVKAGLCDRADEWSYSSASWRS